MIKKPWKRATYHFFIYDVAEATGLSTRKLQRYCKQRRISIGACSLSELVQLINTIKAEQAQKQGVTTTLS